MIEVLTEQAPENYKAFLRGKQIPYLIAGKEEIDIELTLAKLQENYQLENLLLGGGGVLNWSFLREGLCDEVSLIVAPSIDGKVDSARLFDSRFHNDPYAIGFNLKSVEILEDDILWLKYRVANARE